MLDAQDYPSNLGAGQSEKFNSSHVHPRLFFLLDNSIQKAYTVLKSGKAYRRARTQSNRLRIETRDLEYAYVLPDRCPNHGFLFLGEKMPSRHPDKKSEQLGMNCSTAAYRLRRILLLDCLTRLGENTCYRCNQPITDYTDFSVEHKIPWLDNDPALFWDLDNIAWSHRWCNTKAKRTHKHSYGKNREARGTSLYLGVSRRSDYRRRNRPWEAEQKLKDGRRKHLGSFRTEGEAVRAVEDAGGWRPEGY